MHKTCRASLPALLMLLVLAALTPSFAGAQTRADANTVADTLSRLPASDVVLAIDHGRLWSEAIPRIFGDDSAPLKKIMVEMEQFKAKTGVDVRSIKLIAASVRFLNPERIAQKMDKKDFALVIIAQGDFQASKFTDAMRREEKDKVREQTYNGQVIYTLDERPKGSTQPQAEIETPSVAVLDANTIALGDLLQMRATVDARAGNGRLSPDLLSLATRNSNALVSLAGNIPPSLLSSFAPKQKTGNEEMDRAAGKFFESVAAIKQVFTSIGMTETSMEGLLGARFNTAEHAQSLGDLLLGVRQQYGVFIEDKVIRELVEKMQITAQGDEVQLRTEVPQAIITMLVSNMTKAATKSAESSTSTAATPTAKPATTPPAQPRKKTRRSTRRRRG